MSRSPFGWDLPPGCSMRDIEGSFGGDPSEKSEELYGILEDAGVDPAIIDQVVKMWDELESEVVQLREQLSQARPFADEKDEELV